MKLHDLKPNVGEKHVRVRRGRGIAAGKGKTGGRGTKGQRARAGRGIAPYFEGGQLPLSRRLPQLPGFVNKFAVPFDEVNVDTIDANFEKGADVTPEALVAHGLTKKNLFVKVLGRGEVKKALQISAHAFSASAKEKIEKAGGSVKELAWQKPIRKIR